MRSTKASKYRNIYVGTLLMTPQRKIRDLAHRVSQGNCAEPEWSRTPCQRSREFPRGKTTTNTPVQEERLAVFLCLALVVTTSWALIGTRSAQMYKKFDVASDVLFERRSCKNTEAFKTFFFFELGLRR